MGTMIAADFKKVFDSLQDDESKEIFLNRLQYFFDKDKKHLNDMLSCARMHEIARLEKHHDQKKRYITQLLLDKDAKSKKTILYGVGQRLIHILETLGHENIHVECLCDSNTKFHNTIVEGFAVISPAQLIHEYVHCNVIITSLVHSDEIYSFLSENGFDTCQIYVSGSIEEPYWGSSFIRPVGNEIYVDAGTHNGDSIFDFINYCKGNYAKIYGLEPNSNVYRIAEQRIKEHGAENIHLFQKGAWSSNTILSFDDTVDSSSHVDDNKDTKISTITIDEMVGDAHVTLIKMDIEGSELEALKGASSTIKKFKPRLIICIYHKPEDILEIPFYLINLNSEYKFFIRHHDLYSFYDTVLYAL